MIFFRAKGWDERALAERLSRIIEGEARWKPEPTCTASFNGSGDVLGEDGLPPNPRKWQLDQGNNHWLNQQFQHGPDVFSYGHRSWQKDNLAALAHVLKWLLHVEILEVDNHSRY